MELINFSEVTYFILSVNDLKINKFFITLSCIMFIFTETMEAWSTCINKQGWP